MASKQQRLSATVHIGGALSESFRGAMRTSRRELKRVGQAMGALKTRAARLDRAAVHWEKQGRDASRFRREIERVNREIGKLRRNEERLGRVNALASQNLAARGARRGQLGDALGLGVAVAAPVAGAVRFESTLADLNKVTDLTPKRLKAVRGQILAMSRAMPMAADQIGAIMTAAAQAGIAADQVAGFTKAAIKMGVAFDISGDQAGTMLAKWRTGMKLTQPQVTGLADVVNYLSNNMAATAPQIANVISRVGAYAQTAGIGAHQTAALAASMVAAGAAPDKVGTAIRRMASNLTAGAAATKSQREAMSALGLDAQTLARRMQDDAGAAITDVFERVKGLDETARPAVIKRLFGQEAVATVGPLLTNLDGLKQALAASADKSRYAGSMQKEYAARVKTTENNLTLLKNRVVAVGIQLGTVLLPAVNKVAAGLGTVATWVGDAAKQFPVLTKTVIGLAAGLATLKVAAIAGGYGFTFLKGGALTAIGALARVRAGLALTGTALAATRGSMTALKVALIGTGIGAVLVGVASAGALIYKYWSPLKAFFVGLWSGFSTAAQPAVRMLGVLWDHLGPVKTVLAAVGRALASVIGWIGKLFAPVNESRQALQDWSDVGTRVGRTLGDAITGALQFLIKTLPAKFAQLGRAIAGGITRGIKGAVGGVKDAVTGMGASTVGWFKDKLGIHSPSRVFAGLGRDTVEGYRQGVRAHEPRVVAQIGGLSRRVRRAGAGIGLGLAAAGPSPAMAAPAGPTGAPAAADNRSYNFTVVQHAGEDSESLAARVAELVRDQDRRDQASALFDPGPAYGG